MANQNNLKTVELKDFAKSGIKEGERFKSPLGTILQAKTVGGRLQPVSLEKPRLQDLERKRTELTELQATQQGLASRKAELSARKQSLERRLESDRTQLQGIEPRPKISPLEEPRLDLPITEKDGKKSALLRIQEQKRERITDVPDIKKEAFTTFEGIENRQKDQYEKLILELGNKFGQIRDVIQDVQTNTGREVKVSDEVIQQAKDIQESEDDDDVKRQRLETLFRSNARRSTDEIIDEQLKELRDQSSRDKREREREMRREEIKTTAELPIESRGLDGEPAEATQFRRETKGVEQQSVASTTSPQEIGTSDASAITVKPTGVIDFAFNKTPNEFFKDPTKNSAEISLENLIYQNSLQNRVEDLTMYESSANAMINMLNDRKDQVISREREYQSLISQFKNENIAVLTTGKDFSLGKLEREEKKIRDQKIETINDLNKKRSNAEAYMRARFAVGADPKNEIALNQMNEKLHEYDSLIIDVGRQFDDQMLDIVDKQTEIMMGYTNQVVSINQEAHQRIFSLKQNTDSKIDNIEENKVMTQIEKSRNIAQTNRNFRTKTLELVAGMRQKEEQQLVTAQKNLQAEAERLTKHLGVMFSTEGGVLTPMTDNNGNAIMTWEREQSMIKSEESQKREAFKQWESKTRLGIEKLYKQGSLSIQNRNQMMKELQLKSEINTISNSGGLGGVYGNVITQDFGGKFTAEKNVLLFDGTQGTPGIDFDGVVGESISSPISGIVKEVVPNFNSSNGLGAYTVIEDDEGREHIFGHLSGINVEVGERVNRGNPIASIGNSGGVWSTVDGVTRPLTPEERVRFTQDGRPDGSHLDYRVRDPNWREKGFQSKWVNPNDFITEKGISVEQQTLAVRLSRQLFGAKVSDTEREVVTDIVNKIKGEGLELEEGEIIDKFLGFNLSRAENFGSNLKNILIQHGSLADMDMQGLSFLINSKNDVGALSKVERIVLSEAKKVEGDKFISEADTITTVGKVSKLRDLVTKLSKDTSIVGEFSGTLSDWLGRFKGKEESQIKSSIVDAVANMRKSLLGSAITPTEEAFLEPIIPKIGDDLENFLIKLDRLESGALFNYNSMRNSYGLPELNSEQLLDKSLRIPLYNSNRDINDFALDRDNKNVLDRTDIPITIKKEKKEVKEDNSFLGKNKKRFFEDLEKSRANFRKSDFFFNK